MLTLEQVRRAGRPRGNRTGVRKAYMTATVKGSPAWINWLEQFALDAKVSRQVLFEVALERLAASEGYTLPPPLL